MENFSYLDNAATTKVFDDVFDFMKQKNEELFFNPSSSYMPSINVKKQLNLARENITQKLGGKNGRLTFTSSATESNNMVFNGFNLRPSQVVLISKGEHPSVFYAAHALEQKGVIVKEINLDKNGKVDFEHFKTLIDDNVVLISVIHVSNETGAINDIKCLCEYAKKINPNVIFHSDGVQAFGKIQFSVRDLGVDLYTISSHKLYAPRGIAGIWIKNSIKIHPYLLGGGQEDGIRSSTENVLGALAFSYVLDKVFVNINENYNRVFNYKNCFIKKLMASNISQFLKINSSEDASPYILSLTFDKIKGEVLENMLDRYNIYISTGSACSSKKAGNRTLEAMGKSECDIIGSVRVSFSPYLDYDFDYIVSKFEECVLRLENNVKR